MIRKGDSFVEGKKISDVNLVKGRGSEGYTIAVREQEREPISNKERKGMRTRGRWEKKDGRGVPHYRERKRSPFERKERSLS